MPAELADDHVLVREQSEANRIHNKGNYGRPLSGGALRLDLIEAAYLVEVERLDVEELGQELEWSDLLVHASRRLAGFEILYIVFRDLRERGYLVHAAKDAASGAHFHTWPRGSDRPTKTPDAWIRAVSERRPFNLPDLSRFAAAARAAGAQARLALVDEEGDLTFYELSQDAPKGKTPPQPSQAVEGVLLADRVLVPDAEGAARLHEKEFYGKGMARGLQLSLVEAAHLVEEDRLSLKDVAGKTVTAASLRKRGKDLEPQLDLRLKVFADLKGRHLIAKTGFKFGTHFRAYDSRPEEGHAPYLVQAVPADFESPWEPLARAIRLSHSVRKRFYLACPRAGAVDYLSFGRFRP